MITSLITISIALIFLNGAQEEAKAISDRTKVALAAAKARGVQLGSTRPGHWDGREDARLRGARKGAVSASAVRTAKAAEADADLVSMMQEPQASGKSLRAFADALNVGAHTTRRGVEWNQVQVNRVLDRVATEKNCFHRNNEEAARNRAASMFPIN